MKETILEAYYKTKGYQFEYFLLETQEKISKIMGKKNINKSQLAQKLNKSRAFITNVLSLGKNITLKTLFSIFYALDEKFSIISKSEGDTDIEIDDVNLYSQPLASDIDAYPRILQEKENFLSEHFESYSYGLELMILTVQEKISEIMDKKSIRKSELAKKLRKDKSFITRVLSSGENITLRTLFDIFYAMDEIPYVKCDTLTIEINQSMEEMLESYELPSFKQEQIKNIIATKRKDNLFCIQRDSINEYLQMENSFHDINRFVS